MESAYRLAFGRSPSSEETATAVQFLREQPLRIDPSTARSADAAFVRDKIPYRDGRAAVLSPESPRQWLEAPQRAPLTTSDFTIEGFFLLHSIYDSGAVRTIVAQWDGSMKTPGWSFGVTGRGSRRKPQTLVLQLLGKKLEGDLGEAAVFSDQHIQLERPYYAAAAVSLASPTRGPGSVTFYLKDLSNDDEPLLIAKVPHTIQGAWAAPSLEPGQPRRQAGRRLRRPDRRHPAPRAARSTSTSCSTTSRATAPAPWAIGGSRTSRASSATPAAAGSTSSPAHATRASARTEVDPRRAALVDFVMCS